MPEIFAVVAGKVGDSSRELSKKRFCGDECSREMCDRWSCKEKAKTSAREVGCVERVVKGSSGEVNEVTPGWERVRVQIETGAIDTVGLKNIARALELREAVMSKHGVVCLRRAGAASRTTERRRWSGI